jgi:hypothetical protein
VHQRAPRAPQKFDFTSFLEAVERHAFKLAGTIVILTWLYHHVIHELGF